MEKGHYHHLLVNQCDGRGIPVIGAWNSSFLGMETPQGDLNSTLDQHQLTADCFFNSNWDPSSMDPSDPFKSALSSIVSSPVASAGTGNGLVIQELIGRLGSITNSGEVSPQSCNINNAGGGSGSGSSTTPSYFCTPLNSPPKLHLSSGFNTNHNVRQRNSKSQLQFPGTYLHLPPSLSALNADPGFVDRAARLSAFGAGNVAPQFEPEFGYISMLPKLETPGNLSRDMYNQSFEVVGAEEKKVDNNGTVHERTLGGRIASERSGDSREGSSVSELSPAGQSGGGRAVQNDTNSRKRKANAKSKGEGGPAAPNFKQQKKKMKKVGEGENDESPPPAAKRIKQDEDAKEKDNNNNYDNSKAKTGGDGGDDDDGDEKLKNSSSKESAKAAAEPPKDYIHVRARRGQATDSHSLAERVRREKISERMKFLQDLVPGCNKVTGKAVVLDEIINYVQSLQRQVEFLSMKLATVNPGLEFNIESLLSKDSFHCGNGSSLPPPAVLYPLLDSTTHQTLALPYGIYTNGAPENPFSPSNPAFHRNPSIQMQPSVDGFNDAVETTFGSDDLHSIVQMGFHQRNHETMKGTKADTAMKVEL